MSGFPENERRPCPSSGGSRELPELAAGLRRALEIVPAQAVYADAVSLENANGRVAWTQALTEFLAPQLSDATTAALRDFLHEVDPDKPGRRSRGCTRAPTAVEAASARRAPRR